MLPLENHLQAWHEFYALLGTAAATLVGLLFVAASVGGGVWQRRAALRVFLSATEVHFGSILLVCLSVLLPWRGEGFDGWPVGAIGLFGMAYSTIAWRGTVREGLSQSIDVEDRAWYVLVPMLAYVLLTAAGGLLAWNAAPACALLALAMTVLLVAGIRNAWDITVWIVTRPRD